MTENLKKVVCPIIEEHINKITVLIEKRLKGDPKETDINTLVHFGLFDIKKYNNQIIKIYKILCKD